MTTEARIEGLNVENALALAARLRERADGLPQDLNDLPSDLTPYADYDSNVMTFMGNLVIGIGGGPVRPYVVGGVGLIRSAVDGPDGDPGVGRQSPDRQHVVSLPDAAPLQVTLRR